KLTQQYVERLAGEIRTPIGHRTEGIWLDPQDGSERAALIGCGEAAGAIERGDSRHARERGEASVQLIEKKAPPSAVERQAEVARSCIGGAVGGIAIERGVKGESKDGQPYGQRQ